MQPINVRARWIVTILTFICVDQAFVVRQGKKRNLNINFVEMEIGSVDSYKHRRKEYEKCSEEFLIFTNRFRKYESTSKTADWIGRIGSYPVSIGLPRSLLCVHSLWKECSVLRIPLGRNGRGLKVPFRAKRNVRTLSSQASNYRITHFSNSSHILIRIRACVTSDHFIYLFVFSFHNLTQSTFWLAQCLACACLKYLICSWQQTPESEHCSCRRRRRTNSCWSLAWAVFCTMFCRWSRILWFDNDTKISFMFGCEHRRPYPTSNAVHCVPKHAHRIVEPKFGWENYYCF